MSIMLNAAGIFVRRRSDSRLLRQENRQDSDVYADMGSVGSYRSPWWPGGLFVGDQSTDVGVLESDTWGQFYPYAGTRTGYGFTGVTRDQYGSPVGNMVVKVFRTSDDVLQHTTTSGADGSFVLVSPYYPDTHYITVHKTGTPDIDGISPNTLIGA